MINKIDKNAVRQKRHQRIRNKISGTASRPRMAVYRSLSNIYVQIIDDSIYEKTHNMTQDSMTKIGDTLEKVVNENSGLVCLIV